MENHYECKRHILGPKSNHERQVKIINRLLTFVQGQEDEIVTCEADLRHAEIIASELGLIDAESLTTPIVKDEVSLGECHGSALVQPVDAIEYKSLRARANYLAIGRFDMQYVCKALSSGMCKPRQRDWDKPQRLGKHLKGKLRLVHRSWRIPASDVAAAYSDANLVADRRQLKRTSGGCMPIGPQWVTSWCEIESLIATSSAESEFYVAVKTSAEAIGIQSMAKDMGVQTSADILADAFAILGITSRRGIGKARHLDINRLWIQELAANKNVKHENQWNMQCCRYVDKGFA